jgi:hypothetical protein
MCRVFVLGLRQTTLRVVIPMRPQRWVEQALHCDPYQASWVTGVVQGAVEQLCMLIGRVFTQRSLRTGVWKVGSEVAS